MYREKIYKNYLTSDGVVDFDELEKEFNSPFFIDSILKKLLPEKRECRIIDLGCGYGRFLNYLRKNGYTDIQGVELGHEQNIFLKNKGFKIFEQDILTFLKRKDSGKFDFITMFDVLEHFTKNEIIEMLPYLREILDENGILIVRVPNGKAMFSGSITYGDFTHETIFTPRSLKQVLKISGFSTIDIFPVYPIPHGIKSSIRHYGYKIYEFFYRLGLIFETGRIDHILTQNIFGVIRK